MNADKRRCKTIQAAAIPPPAGPTGAHRKLIGGAYSLRVIMIARSFSWEELKTMGPLGYPEMIFIFFLALILFGPKKLPELGRTVGKALTEFRRASTELK